MANLEVVATYYTFVIEYVTLNYLKKNGDGFIFRMKKGLIILSCAPIGKL